MRIVTPTKLDLLKLAIRKFATEFADGAGRWRDEQAVAAHLNQHHLTAGQIFQRYAETPLPPAEA
jgi:hypothetical protein